MSCGSIVNFVGLRIYAAEQITSVCERSCGVLMNGWENGVSGTKSVDHPRASHAERANIA